MCIRDSDVAVRPAGHVHLDAQAVGVCSAQAARALVMFVGPVSYTHLRAHETVLDLVCRLLLEHKTTRKQNDKDRDNLSTTVNYHT